MNDQHKRVWPGTQEIIARYEPLQVLLSRADRQLKARDSQLPTLPCVCLWGGVRRCPERMRP